MYDDAGAGAAAGIGAGMLILYLVLAIFYFIVMWKIFVKAGKPGWGVIIPIYNIILMLEITSRPTWWIVLWIFFFPIMVIIFCFDLAKAFGRSGGFGVGLWILGFIFFPILAFGKAEYQQVQQQPTNA